ncbi:MAG: HD domain-containing protein [Clostridia bacterium]|nr:HD domain-containing protein [Clostridia bacterium]
MKGAELIKAAEDFVKSKFEQGEYFFANPAAKEYRLEHTYRVANIGRQIAEKEGFDVAETVVACLLHDVSYCEDFGKDESGWKDHGRRAARIARPFLRSLGLAEDRVNDICYGIAIHVDDEADFEGERTKFALTVGDADNIDRFDVYRIHETLCYDKFLEMTYDEKLAYVQKKLARLRGLKETPMATPSAQELWDGRLGFYIGFYEKLTDQLKKSKSVI